MSTALRTPTPPEARKPAAASSAEIRFDAALYDMLGVTKARSLTLVRTILSAWCSASLLVPAASTAHTTQPPIYTYTFTPPSVQGSPKISKIELNSDHLQAGGPIAIRVTTTPDVVQVVTGNGNQSGTLTKTGPGTFASESTLPRVGGLATIRISIHFVATTASGQSTFVDVPVHYR
jgi:hypothetical protein